MNIFWPFPEILVISNKMLQTTGRVIRTKNVTLQSSDVEPSMLKPLSSLLFTLMLAECLVEAVIGGVVAIVASSCSIRPVLSVIAILYHKCPFGLPGCCFSQTSI